MQLVCRKFFSTDLRIANKTGNPFAALMAILDSTAKELTVSQLDSRAHSHSLLQRDNPIIAAICCFVDSDASSDNNTGIPFASRMRIREESAQTEL